MDSHFLISAVILLAAAVLVVPLAKRLGLGSVLGYLLAGIAIGPFGLSLITNPEEILHFAEFGVVLMLFLIGMELEPDILWNLRKRIFGLGLAQVVITTLAIAGIAFYFGLVWQESLAIGLALALSSTAMVAQMLKEKNLFRSYTGQSAFSVLLFQDIIVVPIIALLPLLAVYPAASATVSYGGSDLFANLPAWAEPLKILGAVALIALIGRYVIRHAFRFIASARLREVFTATSLLLVIGVTMIMKVLGLSAALGAFVAGVVLANSEYRRAVETDIEPFKGLLLGLFFISVGMSINFDILMGQPALVPTLVGVLLLVKMLVLTTLARFFDHSNWQNITFTLILSQGGEFAFVIFQFGTIAGAISPDHTAVLSAAVALSMLTTPLLIFINERFIQPRFTATLDKKPYDDISVEDHDVIIAGYGRFGQVIGRFLNLQKIKMTVLEHDPDQVELLRRFGNKVFYGDASRLDLMHAAGADKAKIFVVAVSSIEKSLEITKLVKEHFPHLKIFARARNRRHAFELTKVGAHVFRRDTFDSAIWMGRKVLEDLGFRAFHARGKAMRFMEHDLQTLYNSFDFFQDEEKVISHAKQRTADLQKLLSEDEVDPHHDRHAGWGEQEEEPDIE